MTPERWARLKEIFSEALTRKGTERDAFLVEACGGDPELLREARRLVADHERSADFPSSLAIKVSDAEPQQLFQEGQVVAGRFQIVRFLARGGMGEVYEAQDLMLEQRVALKTIQPGLVNENTIGLLKHELQSARRVSHPNVCRTYDIAEHADPRVTLFTMELLQGPTLSSYVREHDSFSRKDALPLAEQLAAGLQAAHDAGVIHGDFKAGNVILTGQPGAWRPVITDFGLALTPTSRRRLAGLRAGTPGYMAPEQIEGKAATPATDVYAFGVVLALMIGARRASGSPSPSPPDPAPSPVDDWKVAGSWQPTLVRCLAADPVRRYQHPADVVRALHRVALRRWAVLLAVAAVLLVLVAVALWRELRPAPAGFVTRKVADEAATDYFEDVSPDGRWIAGSFGEGNLGIRDVRSGDVRLLTNKTTLGGSARDVRFSRDGAAIAYTWLTENGPELRVADVASGNNRLIPQDPSVISVAPAAWLADRTRLAVYADWPDGRSGLGVLSVDTGLVTPVTTSEAARLVAQVAYSPRTGELIFDARENPDTNSTDIFAVRLDGQKERPIVSGPSHDFITGVSADGSRLVYESDFSGSPGIWMLPLGASDETPSLLVPGLDVGEPVGLTAAGELYYRTEANYRVIYTATLDLASRTMITPPKAIQRGESPSWSPDGQTLAFFTYISGVRPTLFFWTRDTGSVRELQVPLRVLFRPQWRTNSSVTGYGVRTGIDGFVDVDPITAEIRPLVERTALQTNSEGSWSADGNVFYNRSGPFRRRVLFRYDVRTKSREEIFLAPEGTDLGLENLALSPDGRTLAFQSRQLPDYDPGTLMLLPTSGGQPRPLLSVTSPEVFLFRAFTWLPDSSALLVAKSRKDTNVSELWLVRTDGSPPQPVDFPAVSIRDLRLNPDGRTIAYHSAEPEHWELRILDNFLPNP